MPSAKDRLRRLVELLPEAEAEKTLSTLIDRYRAHSADDSAWLKAYLDPPTSDTLVDLSKVELDIPGVGRIPLSSLVSA